MTPRAGSFNPPPGWQVPRGFQPGPDWKPDPVWPPAPPGWEFWTDAQSDPVATAPRRARGLLAGALSFIVVVLFGGGALVAFGGGAGIRLLPVEQQIRDDVFSPPLTFVPRHPPTGAEHPQSWTTFGGIDAQFSAGGRDVLLNTNDTVDTWTTKWSGIAGVGPDTCAVTISGRVRDISHTPGIPGGYGLGLARVHGASDAETLTGAALQYDFGQRGYRLARYPSDTDSGLVAAPLDNAWHTFTLRIESSGAIQLELDGRPVVAAHTEPVCGRPTIRVWAGTVEFADLTVRT